MAQSVRRPTLDFSSGHDLSLWVRALPQALCCQCRACLGFSLSLSLPLSLPLTCTLSLFLFLSQNKLKKKKKKMQIKPQVFGAYRKVGPRAWGTSCRDCQGPIAWDCEKGGGLELGRAQKSQQDLKDLFLASQGHWAELPSPQHSIIISSDWNRRGSLAN